MVSKAEQTKKRSMTTDDETCDVRSPNTPAIATYGHRCRERQRNENLRDYNISMSHICVVCKMFSLVLRICLVHLPERSDQYLYSGSGVLCFVLLHSISTL